MRESALEQRWDDLMATCGFAAHRATLEDLLAAWDEPQRHYHTQAHLAHCLRLAQDYAALAQKPAEISLALWFHDAVYKPMKTDNERRSADWAARFLREAGAGDATINTVDSMIMATCHNAPAPDADHALLVDIDLSILGADEARYDAYEQEVRREYRWVPGSLFRRKRAALLAQFLARPRLYLTAELRDRFESQARANLARAIQSLGGTHA
ncbi:MAG: N-methyl-D-aspartate receptor NMDAR2C subunit [Pseudomonadota bacterium]